jgi:hypothetical protein
MLQAVALLDISVETTLYYIMHWNPAAPVFNISGYAGLPLLLGAGIWYLVIEGRIRRDKGLRAALHNEMYLANKHRAQRIALWVVMCALFASFIFEDWSPMLRIICEIIFFIGFSTMKVSWLILNRNRKNRR